MFGVIEMQLTTDSLTINTYTYSSYDLALARYYEIMVNATQSRHLRHTAMIVDEVGSVLKHDTIIHDVVVPEVTE